MPYCTHHGTPSRRHAVSNPEQQLIGDFASPKTVPKSSSGKSLGRVVGVPSLWPRPSGVLQQYGMGVLRQVGVTCRHRMLADFLGVISHQLVWGQRDKRMLLGA